MSANLAPVSGADAFVWTPAPLSSPWVSSVIFLEAMLDAGLRSDPGLLGVTETIYSGYTVPVFADDFFERIHYS